ncbi:hypothetical protein TrST_g1124 [Triparma strigata]|uniref:Uncharacterized protein n=1 Tax=Triparma strigata TaxID=1606541 RepID=A0A9W7AKA2_9STRA|nr:hypothetical protein TrST_g1124 [Triparma strigata]
MPRFGTTFCSYLLLLLPLLLAFATSPCLAYPSSSQSSSTYSLLARLLLEPLASSPPAPPSSVADLEKTLSTVDSKILKSFDGTIRFLKTTISDDSKPIVSEGYANASPFRPHRIADRNVAVLLSNLVLEGDFGRPEDTCTASIDVKPPPGNDEDDEESGDAEERKITATINVHKGTGSRYQKINNVLTSYNTNYAKTSSSKNLTIIECSVAGNDVDVCRWCLKGLNVGRYKVSEGPYKLLQKQMEGAESEEGETVLKNLVDMIEGDDNVLIVGRGAGGSLASILTSSLTSTIPTGGNQTKLFSSRPPVISGFGVGCIPSVSANVACPHFSNFVVGDDLLTRLSLENLEELRKRIGKGSTGVGTGFRKKTKGLVLPGRTFYLAPRNKGKHDVREVKESGKDVRADTIWKVRTIVVRENLMKHGKMAENWTEDGLVVDVRLTK